MRMLDYSLNAMTLLALTLAVGIVIDDAIIVLENIYRWLEEKPEMNPLQAAIDATKEISLAVVATTISLVIIFVPIAFTSGYAKRYLNQFGWTMAVAIMVSMLVAFTLTPTLSARILKRKSNGKSSQHGHRSGPLERGYMKLLGWSLGHRWVIVVICVITFASTVPLYRTIGRDWMPQEDQSELGLSLEMPEGSSLDATERVALELSRKIEKVPGVRAVVPSSGHMGGSSRVAQAQIMILLAPPNERDPERDRSQDSGHHAPGICSHPPRLEVPERIGRARYVLADSRFVAGPGSAKALSGRQGNSQQADDPAGSGRRPCQSELCQPRIAGENRPPARQ